MAMALFLFMTGLLLQDLLLGLMLGLLNGVNLRVLSVHKLIMLGLSCLFSLCPGSLSILLLFLQLLDASLDFFIVLLLDLSILSLLFLTPGISLVLGFLDLLLLLLVLVVIMACSRMFAFLLLLLLDNSFGSLLVGAAAATELLTDVLDDGVVVASQGLGIDAVKVLMGDLILELGLDLGADTLHDLACGDLFGA